MRKNSFWNLSFSSAVKSLSPVIVTEISEDAPEKAIRQASHQSHVYCWTSRKILLKKHLTSVCIYILLRERELHVKKSANHCQSVPNPAHLTGLWHSPHALLVPTLGSQINTSPHLQNQNQWAVVWNAVCGVLALHGISPTQLSSHFVPKRELLLQKGTCLSSRPYAMGALSTFLIKSVHNCESVLLNQKTPASCERDWLSLTHTDTLLQHWAPSSSAFTTFSSWPKHRLHWPRHHSCPLPRPGQAFIRLTKHRKEDSSSKEREHTFQCQKTYEVHERAGLASCGTHEAKSTWQRLGAQAANGSALAKPHR